MDITWLGHSAFQITSGDTDILIDPFLTGNPKGAKSADELEPNHILLSHGHQDHYGDLVEIAKRTGAQVVAPTEIADELTKELDAEQLYDPNLGGTVTFDWGWVKMVPAWHTSTTPNGTVCTPMGLLIKLEDKVIYFTGDTCLFSDMQLVARRGDGVDVAILPIGGHYTMDRFDAVAAVEFISPKTVIPCHYGTFPPVETDAQAFKDDVESSTGATCVVLDPGQTHSE
jgi:L-ascorbate metabolism protein UlaG (beta-lactamase superfamily)